MSGRLIFSGLCLCSSLLCCQLVIAEEPARGRLPDGRAFRTDSDGTQLVDYIAELEVNIESLNRQVLSLQDEVHDKEQQIQRLSKGLSQKLEVKEKNLVNGQGEAASSASVRDEWACPKMDCGQVLEHSKAELEGVREDLEVEKRLSAKRAEEHNTTLSQLKSVLEQKDSQLQALKNQLGQADGGMKKVSQEIKANFEQQLSERDLQIEGLRAKLDFAGKELAKARSEREISARVVNETEVMARMKANVLTEGLKTRQDSPRVLEEEKESLRGKIDGLKKLVSSRNEVFATRGQASSSPVAIAPSEAVTADGHSIEDLEIQLSKVNTEKQLVNVSRGISEIQARVQEDIAVAQRMEKLGQ